MIHGVDHVTINTVDLAKTERFFVDIIGMELARRPALRVDGIWLKGGAPDGPAVIHIVVRSDHAKPDGALPNAVDHIALHAEDFERIKSRIDEHGLPWRGVTVDDFGLWQLMLFDPNGVLIELNFKAQNEAADAPDIPARNRISSSEFRFIAEAYAEL